MSTQDTHRSAERVIAELIPPKDAAITQLPPKAVDPAQGAALIGVSESTMYELLRQNRIRSFKVGRRRVIPVAAIDEWIASELAEAAGQ